MRLLLRWSQQEDTVSHSRQTHSDDAKVPSWHDEPDIGSGEKTPADHETDELIRQIPPLPPSPGSPARHAPVPPAPARR
jgi:hypothetical protein